MCDSVRIKTAHLCYLLEARQTTPTLASALVVTEKNSVGLLFSFSKSQHVSKSNLSCSTFGRLVRTASHDMITGIKVVMRALRHRVCNL